MSRPARRPSGQEHDCKVGDDLQARARREGKARWREACGRGESREGAAQRSFRKCESGDRAPPPDSRNPRAGSEDFTIACERRETTFQRNRTAPRGNPPRESVLDTGSRRVREAVARILLQRSSASNGGDLPRRSRPLRPIPRRRRGLSRDHVSSHPLRRNRRSTDRHPRRGKRKKSEAGWKRACRETRIFRVS